MLPDDDALEDGGEDAPPVAGVQFRPVIDERPYGRVLANESQAYPHSFRQMPVFASARPTSLFLARRAIFFGDPLARAFTSANVRAERNRTLVSHRSISPLLYGTQASPCALMSARRDGPMPVILSMSSTELNGRSVSICSERTTSMWMIKRKSSTGAVLMLTWPGAQPLGAGVGEGVAGAAVGVGVGVGAGDGVAVGAGVAVAVGAGVAVATGVGLGGIGVAVTTGVAVAVGVDAAA